MTTILPCRSKPLAHSRQRNVTSKSLCNSETECRGHVYADEERWMTGAVGLLRATATDARDVLANGSGSASSNTRLATVALVEFASGLVCGVAEQRDCNTAAR